MMEPATITMYLGGTILLLLLIRGLWVLKKSGDARLETLNAQVKAREGRNPEDAMSYEQEVEAKAMAYLQKIPLVGRLPIFHFDKYQDDP